MEGNQRQRRVQDSPEGLGKKDWASRFFDLDPDDLPDLDNQEYTPSENSGGAEASGEQIVTEPEEEVAVPSHRGSMDEGENIPIDGPSLMTQMMNCLVTQYFSNNTSAKSICGRWTSLPRFV